MLSIALIVSVSIACPSSSSESDPADELPPAAPTVDLSEPVITPPAEPEPAEPEVERPGGADAEGAPQKAAAHDDGAFHLLGQRIERGTAARLSWTLDQRFEGIAVPTPVLIVHGREPGPTLCIVAAIHGDELNGIEIVRRVLYDLEPKDLRGTVIGVPIVNLPSFRRGSRYLPDRRDLNRFFPGTPMGSSAARIAHSFFNDVILACSAVVDLHTGSLRRTNLPQVRANMQVRDVAALAEGFGATAVLHSIARRGTLRHAAVEAGIPAVTLEAGAPHRLDERDIAHGTKAVRTLLGKTEMLDSIGIWGAPEPVYYRSTWIRANRGGLLFTSVQLGQRVREGDRLGVIIDPITNVESELRAVVGGRILGMAFNQVVMPGFATFRIGIKSTEDEITAPGGAEPQAEEEDLPYDDEPS